MNLVAGEGSAWAMQLACKIATAWPQPVKDFSRHCPGRTPLALVLWLSCSDLLHQSGPACIGKPWIFFTNPSIYDFLSTWLKASLLNQDFNSLLSSGWRGGRIKDIKIKCYSYSSLAFLWLSVKDKILEPTWNSPDKSEWAIHMQTFLLILSCFLPVLKSECLVDTSTALRLFRGVSWLHCVEHVDTKINTWQLSNFPDWKCEGSRSFGVIWGNSASSQSSFSLCFFSGPSDFVLVEKENGNNGKYMNGAPQNISGPSFLLDTDRFESSLPQQSILIPTTAFLAWEQ